MRAEIGRCAGITTTTVVVKEYQLTYPTLLKQTLHEFKNFLKERKHKTTIDHFETKEL